MKGKGARQPVENTD